MRYLMIVLLGTFLALSSYARADVADSVSADARETLRRIEQDFGQSKKLQARFLQITSAGNVSEGTLKIQRPGKMRLEYDPPVPMLLVADGTWMILVDTETGQPTNVPLRSTPAGILLRDKLSFDDPDILVTSIREEKTVFEINIIEKKQPDAGVLTMVFSLSPLEFRKWIIKDAQGIETSVSLSNMQTNVTFRNEDFVYINRP